RAPLEPSKRFCSASGKVMSGWVTGCRTRITTDFTMIDLSCASAERVLLGVVLGVELHRAGFGARRTFRDADDEHHYSGGLAPGSGRCRGARASSVVSVRFRCL